MPSLLALAIFLLLEAVSSYEWGIMIDAGSSGSRLRIYYWNERKSSTENPDVQQYIPANVTDENLLEVVPGLSYYANNPTAAGPSIQSIVDQSKRWIPQDVWSVTPIYLRATAGLRLLYPSQQSAIYTSVRATLHSSPYRFHDDYATISSGEQEAVWAWICVNYLAGYLNQPTSEETYIDTLELGGASTQVAFLPDSELLANQFDVEVFQVPLKFYAVSFLNFGKDQFRDRVRARAIKLQSPSLQISLPCFYVGYSDVWASNGVNYTFTGTGDWANCYENYTQPLMGLDIECLQEPCSFFGVYQPPLPVPRQYWSMGAYFYTVNSLGLVSWNDEWTGTVADIEPVGMANCLKNWSSIVAANPGQDPYYLYTVCLDTTLVISLLRAVGAENINVSYARKRFGQTLGWPLGAILDELGLVNTTCLASTEQDESDDEEVNALLGVVIALGVLLLLFICGFYCYYRRKNRGQSTAHVNLG